MYGQTEASPRISYLPWKFLPKKIGSIGKGLSGYKIFLVDKNKKIIKKNYKEGELAIKGKNVFLGYAESLKDLYTGDINKELLYTGDLAIKDKDGFYYINGRKNRFVKIFGYRLNLDDIEKFLYSKNLNCKLSVLDEKLSLKIEKKDEHMIDLIYDYIFKEYNIAKNYILVDLVKKINYSKGLIKQR